MPNNPTSYLYIFIHITVHSPNSFQHFYMHVIVTMLSPDAAARRFAVLHVLVSLAVSSSFVSADHSNGFEGDRKGVTNKLVPAVFVFGDSTVDPGNNEFYPTIARGNFSPYGVDFPQGIPSGRFCNGRLAPDFIASYLGVKDTIPPYLDPSLSIDDLVTGVSFASAGSGYDPHTPTVLNVISMSEQLRYFSEYKTRLEQSIGKERTQETIEKAIYVVSSGTNDLLFQFAIPGLPLNNVLKYDVSAYQRLIVDLCKQFTQDLIAQGARKIAIVNTPPIGCIPIVLTINPPLFRDPTEKRSCIDSLSAITRGYNKLLKVELKALQSSFITSNHTPVVVYADIYNPFNEFVTNPEKFGFEVVDRGCCGTGLLELSFLCNHLSPICSERSKYIFFDSVHPTEATYRLLTNALIPVVDFLARHQ
ncbi:hypothetical protein Droror1_Dr00020927 [Drosera rotundifolia]